MGMGNLGTFEPTSQIEGDRLKAAAVAEAAHPLLVNIVDKRENMRTQYSPAGDGKALYLDILDLTTQEVFIHVMWMNEIIWDNLNGHIGETLPIRLRMKDNKTKTNQYITVEALTDEEIAVAQQWVDAKPNLFDDTRRQRDIPTAEQVRAGATSGNKSEDSGISAMGQSSAAPTPPPSGNVPPTPPTGNSAPAAPPAPPTPGNPAQAAPGGSGDLPF